MNIEEFQNTRMGPGDKFRKNSDGEVYDIVSIDFEESLFAYRADSEQKEAMWWVRCENVEFIPFDRSLGSVKEQANEQ